MKRRNWFVCGLSAVMLLLTACGSSDTAFMTEEIAVEDSYADTADAGGGIYSKAAATYDMNGYEDAMPAAEAVAEEEYTAEEGEASAGRTADANPVPDEAAAAKKLIKNVNLEVETKEYDALLADITAQVSSLGGYIENSTSSDYSGGTSRSASIVARVPSGNLDSFVNRVSEQSNVIYRNESVQDVTLQYVDLDSHKKSLMTEQERLLELLEKAETVADIIEIESRLSEVRYQIESMESQLRTIDNQVSYSTVYISVYEVELLTPAAEKTVWQRISDGFRDNLYRLGRGLENVFVYFVISLPFILIWVVVIVILLLIVRFILKREKKMKEKRQRKADVKRAQEADYIVVPTGNEQNIPAGPPETKKPEEKDGQNGTTV